MKKIISTIVVASIGGFTALGLSNFIKNDEPLSQVTHPDMSYHLTNYVGGGSAGFADFTMAAEKSVNAVVHINTVSQQVNNLAYDPFAELFFGPQKRQQIFEQRGSGSGVVISEDGYIVTNNHVVNGAEKIEVILNDKRTYVAELIGSDASTDVALLKIKEKNLSFLTYGNSDAVRVGEWALAIGNPFNLNSTVTAGIISAKGRNNILNGNQRPIESFIQTDAAVNPGNSGGALVNTNGELIGINTAIASNNGAFQGYSFAVPVNIVKKIVSDLVEFGAVQRAYIGVSIQDIDSKLADTKGLKQLKGIYVNGISAGGSAQDAGIEEGDVITSVHDVPITSVSELQEQVSRYRPGDKISVTILRNNKEMNLPVVLKTFDNTTKLVKKNDLVKKSIQILGADFINLDFNELSALHAENGVKIEKIGTGKLAQVGVQQGFVITSIDRKKVSTLDDVQKLLGNKNGTVLLEGFYPNGMRASYSFGI
jgi:Do/DeqQ family serine protease